MEKLANGRSFEYDVRSLLGINMYPPVYTGQINMTISGLPGTQGNGTWAGLGNGIHKLYGVELAASFIEHRWHYDATTGDYLRMYMNNYGDYWIGFVDIRYDGDANKAISTINTLATNDPLPFASINDVMGGTATVPATYTFWGVTFTWYKGNEWNRGNM